MDIIDLPYDLFLLILAQLSADATVRCRRVSKRWHAALTDPDLCLQLMKWHFSRCREMRLAYGGGDGQQSSDDMHHEDDDVDWTATWTTVARRYHHLHTATPRAVDKIKIGTAASPSAPGGGGDGEGYSPFLGVGTWDRYLRLDDKEAPFHYPDPSWCYGQDEGVLVYQAHPDEENSNPVRAHYYPWRLLDLATGAACEVPFPHDPDERLVRRVRLADAVLVFEWCERRPYHQLNDREQCHRHFVTAFDVVSFPGSRAEGEACCWAVTERAEWKLHFLGFPLNQHDRFFSAHTATHYAVYVWQPNRSQWGEDDPIESVILWDISLSGASGSSTTTPKIVRRMTWPTLAFYRVRQRSTPKLRRLALDRHNLYFVEEEHRWAQGGHSSLSPPRGHLVRCTGIPVIPSSLPSSSASSSPSSSGHNNDDQQEEEEAIVQGPRWFDACGADGDANLSFCTRLHNNIPPTSTSTAQSQETTTTTTNYGGLLWNFHDNMPPHNHPVGQEGGPPPRAAFAQEREAAARVATTRWPGWAPCWRHEEFPYLTGMSCFLPNPKYSIFEKSTKVKPPHSQRDGRLPRRRPHHGPPLLHARAPERPRPALPVPLGPTFAPRCRLPIFFFVLVAARYDCQEEQEQEQAAQEKGRQG